MELKEAVVRRRSVRKFKSTPIADLPADDFGLIVNKSRFGDGFIDYLRAYPDKLAVQTLFDNSVPLI